MDRKEKQQQVFTQLVNKQLLPFGKTYQDVKSDPLWYLRFSTTIQEERDFMEWGRTFLQSELQLTEKQAEMEMSWYIVQYGLNTNRETVHASQSVENIQAKTKSAK